jgi:predicted Rossmann-fold nucleotide-binding protein
MKYVEITGNEAFVKLIENSGLSDYIFRNIDFRLFENKIRKLRFSNCLFLGCQLPPNVVEALWHENSIFPKLDVPFDLYPHKLYDASVLYDAYIPGKPETYIETFDFNVYSYFMKYGKENLPIIASISQRLHDQGITDALHDFLAHYPEKKLVAIMGGHTISRNSAEYRQVALLSKKLTETGYLMISGGGPGAMEATHLGAWFASRSEKKLEQAFEILKQAPDYKHKLWLDKAFEVIVKYPRSANFESLGVPTWFYGHEPASPFASKIAKYFANSIREDGLLSIAKGGIVFTPGSAGTLQEIFQDAAQNHYKVFGYPSPMIFYGKSYWNNDVPAFPFLQNLQQTGKYQNLILFNLDNMNEVVAQLNRFSES